MKIMKLFTFAAVSAVFALTMNSCDDKAKLAESVQGTWSGSPVQISDAAASSVTVIDTYSFTREDGTNGGNVTISAMISATGQVTGSETIVHPFSLSAAGEATISGTWDATDEDEIAINLDPKTLDVKVDPQAVVVSANVVDGTTTSAVDSIKPALVNSLRTQLTVAIQQHFLSLRHLDDVKVKDSRLTYEIADSKFVLTRQGNIDK